jgi:hypothetical protein
MKVLTIHPKAYDQSLELLKNKYSKLSVGYVQDPDADIVMPSKNIWALNACFHT